MNTQLLLVVIVN